MNIGTSLTLATLAAALALATGTVRAAEAVSPDGPVPGQRVRIQAPEVSHDTLVGTVSAVDADFITIAVAGRATPLSVPRTRIVKLEVSEGPRSRGTHALIGAGIGLAVGALIGSTQNAAYIHSGGVAAVGGIVGAGIGALIGVAIPPGDRWAVVPNSHLQVGFAPRGTPANGAQLLGLNFSISF